MTDDYSGQGGDDIADRVTVAGEALDALAEGPAQRAADAISAAFRDAGAEIEDALVKAARTGELSFQSMAASVGRELSALAAERFIRAPVGDLLDGLLSGAFAGARAGGGPVAGGGAYLVGETGPEVFRPAGAGSVEPLGGRPVVVNVNVPSGAGQGEVFRSEGQLAAAMGRAAARAMRRL